MNNCIIINGQHIELTQEQVQQIVAAHSAATAKLADIPAGATFKLGDYEFVVLEQFGETAAVILKDLLPDTVEFSDGNNRYDGSNPDQACCDFAEELFLLAGSENVIPHTVDLTSDDGFKDYGTIERAVSLLTADEYRNYVEILDKHKPDCWWWLATPHSTKRHENDRWIKSVAPSGYMNSDDCNDGNGVRPFCILKSNIFVSV